MTRLREALDRHGPRLAELWRYYKIGLINTAFGFGLYAVLIRLGLNLYAAQIVSHVISATFNYFMFSRHVFHGKKPSIVSYITTYAVNYLLGLLFITLFHMMKLSPYLAGFFAVVAVSFINYFMLKLFVFKHPEASED